MFVIIITIFSLLALVAFNGDYEEKEKQKDYELYWKIVKGE